MILATQDKHKLSLRVQCKFHGICSKQVSRWTQAPKQREPKGFSISLIQSFDDEFLEAFDHLSHKTKRTHGTSQFHEALREKLPRRQRQQLINEERKEYNQVQINKLRALKWNDEMTCWAMDDTHIFTNKQGEKTWIHNIKDLGSQYILPPVSGPILNGEEVAQNLRALFERFGAPLFLKRDNGPNLTAEAVDKVLEEFQVIPLNSPPYYSQYNGSIEQANGLLKTRIKSLAEQHNCPINEKTISVLAALAAHEENTQIKRSLGRITPSFYFFGFQDKTATNKTRKEVINDILEQKKLLIEKKNPQTKREEISINRKAIEAVLEKRGYITIIKKELVSTLF